MRTPLPIGVREAGRQLLLARLHAVAAALGVALAPGWDATVAADGDAWLVAPDGARYRRAEDALLRHATPLAVLAAVAAGLV